MMEPGALPDREALIAELGSLRTAGIPKTRSLDLPVLSQAARRLGLTDDVKAEQAVVEALVRDAVGRLGGGDFQTAAECTFGLQGGTRFQSDTERRRVAADCLSVTTDTFRKSHEKLILDQVAEGILERCRAHAAGTTMASESADEPQGSQAQPDRTHDAPIEPLPPSVPPPRRRRLRKAAASIALVVVTAAVAVAALLLSRPTEAERIEARYDNKDPLKLVNDECAGPIARSQSADTKRPELLDIDKRVVGTVEVRTWPDCPVVFGRVLWNDDPDAHYRIPDGWTLHVEMHRPATDTVEKYSEPSSATSVRWAYGPTLATVRGCVYVEAYFTDGTQDTLHAQTACVTP